MATSERDFDYCQICRQNHQKGKKHLYSKGHREKIKNILLRFGKKVKSAKEDIAAPCILPGSYEPHSSYWCYPCQCEVTKHVNDGHITVRHAGFIEHLKSDDHLVKTDAFWRENRLDRVLKLQYVLTEDDYIAFKPALERALNEYEDEQRKDIDKRASKIRQVEAQRKRLFEDTSSQPTSLGTSKFPATISSSVSGQSAAETTSCNHGDARTSTEDDTLRCSNWNNHSHQSKEKTIPTLNVATPSPSSRQQGSHRNIEAGGPATRKTTANILDSGGLTSIRIQALRPGEGNVHTGATPPWMLDDEDDERSVMMGPSLEDYNKHLERQRKGKLNPNRVGANFDHVTPTQDEWLPSFGRVWNQGRRWQSRHQFRRETGQQMNSIRKQPYTRKPAETLSKPPP